MRKCFLRVSVLFFSFCAFSQEARVLTVDDAVKLALENNVSVQRSEITLSALERAKKHSWNSASPSISFDGTAGIPLKDLTDEAARSKYDANFGISATVSVSLTANLYTKMQAAKLNYEIGKMNFTDSLRSIELNVRDAFYKLLYEKENIVLQEKNSEISKSQYSANLAKYNQGRLSELDVLAAEVSYKSTVPTVEGAKTTYENDLAAFKQLLGIPLDESVELSGKLEDKIFLDKINLDGVEIFSSSVKTLEKRVEAADNSILDNRFSAYSPSIRASLNWRDQYWYSGYDGDPPASSDAAKSTSLSLSASIPLDGLLPWSAKHDAIESAKDSKKDYELQLKNAKTTLQMSIDSYLRSIENSQASIKAKQANVTLAQRSYNMTLDAYNRGAKDFLSVQNASSSLLSAQVSLKNEILKLISAMMNLENTIGVQFESLSNKMNPDGN